MKVLYNEGRVAGLAAYESYLRQILSVNPSATPLDERKWLSASLSANQSMILKVSAGTTKGYHDYTLPATSDLCGCSVIYASIFEGKCTVNETDVIDNQVTSGCWANRVDDYGRLISNTYQRHPETPGLPPDVPAKEDPTTIPYDYMVQCNEFMKISSALMLQPGEWITNIEDVELLNESGIPVTTEDGQELLVPYNAYEQYASFSPDLSKPGFVRLAITDTIVRDVYIILTGFSYKTLVYGQVSYEHLDFAQVPEDGDFLGPARFPWGCKIILTLTSDITNKMMEDIRDVTSHITSPLFWVGTRDEWDAVNPAAKLTYQYVSITDE